MPRGRNLFIIFLTLVTAGWLVVAAAQAGFVANPVVSYQIDVRLDVAAKTLHGHEILTWRNPAREAVPELQFHLYWNAIKNLQSTLAREAEGFRLRLRGENEKWGWIEIDSMKTAQGIELKPGFEYIAPDDGNPDDTTVLRVRLPKPIPPNGSIELHITFRAKIPRGAVRAGFAHDFFFIVQWFPKLGVYEPAGMRGRKEGGWNCHQYHRSSEFYADYGTYDVRLTVPANYVVGATGRERQRVNNPDGTTTYNFYQEDVHDFAWTAYPGYLKLTRTFRADQQVSREELRQYAALLGVPEDEVRLSDVEVTLLLQPEHAGQTERYFRAVFNALKYYGLWYGRYPYETLTVVDPSNAGRFCGGMEYPTLFTAGTRWWPARYAFSPEGVTVHEFGHQFWYGLVGNNEFEEAWLDEGFTSYSTGKVLATAYGQALSYERPFGIPIPAFSWLSVRIPPYPLLPLLRLPLGGFFERVEVEAREGARIGYLYNAKSDQMARFAWEFLDPASYGTNSYGKASLMLLTLERYLGEETMARLLRTYHQRYRFGHPSAQDFIATAEEVSGQQLDWFFDQFVFGSNTLDYAVTARSQPPPQAEGVYLKEGQPAIKRPEKAGKPEPQFETVITVRRLGEVIFPVQIEARFANGEVVRETWDGAYRWKKFRYLKPVRLESVRVDPENVLALDVNQTNNSYRLRAHTGATGKWYLRWLFWIQQLLFGLGFFS